MKYLSPPNYVRDQPIGSQRGGIFDAPWVEGGYADRRAPVVPTLAATRITRGVPPSRQMVPMPFARYGMGEFITSPVSASPTRPIMSYQDAPPAQPPTGYRQGVFDAPWLAPSVDAGPVEDLQTATPGWVRRQEDSRLITGPPPGGLGAWPGNLVQDSVFGRRR